MLELLPPRPIPADRSGERAGALGLPAGRRSRANGLHVAFPRGSDALLVVAMVALGITLLLLLPRTFGVDSWLALVAGREVWSGGLPHQETLTAMSHGAPWVDQQWLSQLASYAIYRIGGLGLLGVTSVTMMTVAVGAAVLAARRRGARAWGVMAMFGLCLTQILPAGEVRTQAFAMPLIVATTLLLSADSRRHTRRVYWCLPILVVWANLHGTALIGAAMVCLRGLLLASDRWREAPARDSAWRRWRGPVALTLGAPLCLLITPYGLSIVSYYQATMMNSGIRHLVTEWQPITSDLAIAVPFFILAGLVVWSFGRRPTTTTVWEKVVLLVLAASSIMVIRNGLLFGLAALAIVPASLDAALPRRPPRTVPVRNRLNTALCVSTFAALAIVIMSTLLRPGAAFEHYSQRPRVLDVVRAATLRDPTLKVFADVRFADWLLWRDPQLRGRIANDARFELLTGSQMIRLVRVLSAVGPDWKQGANGYRLLVLDRAASPDSVRGFLAEPGHRVLYDDGERIVILRSARGR